MYIRDCDHEFIAYDHEFITCDHACDHEFITCDHACDHAFTCVFILIYVPVAMHLCVYARM
jgi:hypothetical protein